MPWKVARSSQCYSAGKPWAVILIKTGKVVACHETEEKALAQLKALYASEDKKKKHKPSKTRSFERAKGGNPHWTDDDVVFLSSQRADSRLLNDFPGKPLKGNPYHVLHGPKGGQFTSKPGGGVNLDLPKTPGFSLKSKPLGVQSSLEGLPKDHPTRKKVDAVMQQHGFRNAQQAIDECVREMYAMLDGRPTLVDRARAWYRDENVTAHRRAAKYKVSASTAAAVESATSPRCRYVTNQQATDAIFERKDKFDSAEGIAGDIHGLIMNSFKLQGAQLAKGASPETLTGAKRRSFYNNIMFPGRTNDVTIDGRMAQVLQKAGARHARKAKKPLTPRPDEKGHDPGLAAAQELLSASAHTANMNDVGAGYYVLADATRIVAGLYGESPDTIQSAVWIRIGGEGR